MQRKSILPSCTHPMQIGFLILLNINDTLFAIKSFKELRQTIEEEYADLRLKVFLSFLKYIKAVHHALHINQRDGETAP